MVPMQRTFDIGHCKYVYGFVIFHSSSKGCEEEDGNRHSDRSVCIYLLAKLIVATEII